MIYVFCFITTIKLTYRTKVLLFFTTLNFLNQNAIELLLTKEKKYSGFNESTKIFKDLKLKKYQNYFKKSKVINKKNLS